MTALQRLDFIQVKREKKKKKPIVMQFSHCLGDDWKLCENICFEPDDERTTEGRSHYNWAHASQEVKLNSLMLRSLAIHSIVGKFLQMHLLIMILVTALECIPLSDTSV